MHSDSRFKVQAGGAVTVQEQLVDGRYSVSLRRNQAYDTPRLGVHEEAPRMLQRGRLAINLRLHTMR